MDSPDPSVNPLRSALVLAVFAAVATGLVALVHEHSAARIAANQTQAQTDRLMQILPLQQYEEVPGENHMPLVEGLAENVPQPVYRAWRAGKPAASAIQVTASDGYNGGIVLLVAVDIGGEVLGVRTLRHRETPGLGDAIDIAKGDWITRFDGRSLGTQQNAWAVRRDGGQFDQLTGATVTSRAVVRAVRTALVYFESNRERIFSTHGER